MSKHEFYADPTVFDHWQSSAGSWLCAQGVKVSPYGWTLAFAALGTLLAGISAAVFGASFHDTVSRQGLPWNQLLVQGITVVVAMAAAQTLFRYALDAWPGHTVIPLPLRRAARYVGWRPAAPAAAPVPGPVVARGSEREVIQAFFAGVREAGVNVTIAKALFAAGIRSPKQLREASDRQLAAIHGVGPATVRKLRTRFAAPR